MDTMKDFETTRSRPEVGVPLDKLKPKPVRRRLDLTLWEKVYVPEVLRGISITTVSYTHLTLPTIYSV